MSKSLILILSLCLAGLSFGQTAWDQGELSLTYGSPIPNQSWEVNGSILNGEVPAQGVGGFSVNLNDTSLTVILAYDMYTEGTDTLADAFLVVLQEPGELQAGTYLIDPTPGHLKLFAWFEAVDPELVMSLLDSSFAFEDLSTLNPFLSLSGQLEINAANLQGLSMDISGTLVNTSFQIRMISQGSIAVQNSLPIPVFGLGVLDITSDGVDAQIAGNLNPLIDSDGVGALFYESGDTLSYTFMAYEDQGNNTFDVYGLELMGHAADFASPLTAQIPLSVDPETFPRATPLVLENVSLDTLGLLLQSGDLSTLTNFQDIFLPVGVADATLTGDPEAWMSFEFHDLLMANLAGESMLLSEEWYVGQDWPTAVDPVLSIPASELLVGAPYPNPFNSSTVIPLELKSSQNLELVVFNLLGQEKMRTNLGYMQAGNHQVRLDLAPFSLPAGFYHFQIRSEFSDAQIGAFLYLK